MRYIRPDQVASPQLLQVEHGGAVWRLALIHCTSDERRQGRPTGTPHAHALYHIVLFTRGTNAFHLDGHEVTSAAGTLVLCSPGVMHEFGPLRPGATLYDEITFAMVKGTESLSLGFGDLLSLFAGQMNLRIPLVTQLAPAAADAIRNAMRAVMKYATAGTALDAFWAHAAMVEVMRLLVAELVVVAPGESDVAERAHRAIALRFAEPVSIGLLAEDAGVTPQYLSRLFRQRYGQSPMQFRQHLRVSAAARLLQSSGLSCKEVASRLGFADVQSFTKAFARYRGQTPGKLARMGR